MRRPLCLLCLCYVFVVYVILRLFPPQSRTDIPPDGTYFTCSGEVTAIEIQNDKSILYLSVSGESNHNSSSFVSEESNHNSSSFAAGESNHNSSSFVSEESNHNSVLLGNDLHIICYFQDASLTSRLKPGNQVCITGICRHFQTAANDGQFDAKQYYEMLGLDFAMTNCTGSVSDDGFGMGAQLLYLMREKMSESFDCGLPPEDAGVMKAMLLGKKGDMDEEVKGLYQRNGISHILAISGVKTLKLDIPLVPETRINWAFVPLHIAIIYILKLCLNEEIIPLCRFPCSRGYRKKYINWQKKQ